MCSIKTINIYKIFSIFNFKKEFNNKIKELNPEYAASNAKFADEARIQEAFDLGSTYNKLDADELAFKIKNLKSV